MAIMSVSERAAQIWPVLALAARNRQILTYDIVGRLIGVPARGLGHLLEPIQSDCLSKDFPPLTILVVQEATGTPGVGFIAASANEFSKKQLEVFDFDWLNHSAPTPKELAAAVQHPSSKRRS